MSWLQDFWTTILNLIMSLALKFYVCIVGHVKFIKKIKKLICHNVFFFNI